MKATKLEELERQKAMRELRECTFKPNVLKVRDKSCGKAAEQEENESDELAPVH